MTTPTLVLAWIASYWADHYWREGPGEPQWLARFYYLGPWAMYAVLLLAVALPDRVRTWLPPVLVATAIGVAGAFYEPRGGLGLYSLGVFGLEIASMAAALVILWKAPDRYRCGVAFGIVGTIALTLFEFVMSRSAQIAPALGQSRLAAIYGETPEMVFAIGGALCMALGIIWGRWKERNGWPD